MRLLALILLLIHFTSGVSFQSIAQQSSDPERVYFLIDSSGSMQDVHPKLQDQVSEYFEEVRDANPDVQIYTSFFGADTASECYEAPAMQQLDAASGGIVVPNDGYKQSTPLGEAIRSAVIDAQGSSARILLFSDEEQTAKCGVDICTIVESYLPVDGLTVESIPIGADPQDRDRLGCIMGAQFSNGSETKNEGSMLAGSERAIRASKSQKGWDQYRLREQLPFMFGFALILLSAFFFQMYYGSRALNVEKQIGELSEELPNPYPDEDIQPKKLDDDSTYFLKRIEFWLALAGLVVLGAVVFWPRNASFFAEYFVQARSVAWLVVDSTFFTGVAILGIAPLLLAGAQYWRHAQARQKFYVASGNYTLEKRRRIAEQIAAAIDAVAGLQRAVREVEFRSPPEPTKRRLGRSIPVFGPQRGERVAAPVKVDADNWEQVCERVRQIVSSVTYPEEMDAIESETNRLEKYLKLRGGKTKRLPDFISLMVADEKLKLEAGDWTDAVNAINSQSVSRVNRAIAKLASD